MYNVVFNVLWCVINGLVVVLLVIWCIIGVFIFKKFLLFK